MSLSREPGTSPGELGLPDRVVDDVVDPAADAFARLVAVQAKLRRPDGCPWDREQTHDSLARHLLEETYEVLEAIDHGDLAGLREELGDLVLQVVFHAYLAYEEDAFTVADVLDDLRAKLVHRHPHVFAEPSGRRPASVGGEEHDRRVSAAEKVLQNWERIKREEKGRSVMEGVPRALPALARAAKFSRRAAQVGFDWPTADGAREKVLEELDELTEETADADGADPDRVTDELGDLLFAVASWARKLDVEPETALRRASDRFAERFASMEAEAAAAGRELESLSPDEWTGYWDRANPATGEA